MLTDVFMLVQNYLLLETKIYTPEHNQTKQNKTKQTNKQQQQQQQEQQSYLYFRPFKA